MLSFDIDLATLATVWWQFRLSGVLAFVKADKGVVDILVSCERFSQGLSPGLSGSGVRPFSRARFCQGQSWTEALLLFSDMLEDSQA